MTANVTYLGLSLYEEREYFLHFCPISLLFDPRFFVDIAIFAEQMDSSRPQRRESVKIGK